MTLIQPWDLIHGIMTSRLVTGNAKHLAPRSEIQPYTEGNSTFYAPARETIKLGACAPPHNPPFSIQETRCDRLELSSASVTSRDVTMQQVS